MGRKRTSNSNIKCSDNIDNQLMAHRQTNDSQVEWAQRELNELHINENQGRPNLIQSPPNYFNTPTQKDLQSTMDAQRHHQEREPTKYHNRQIEPHAHPKPQHYNPNEQTHNNQVSSRPYNQPTNPSPHRTIPTTTRSATPINIRQCIPLRHSPTQRPKSNTPTSSFRIYRETTNNPNLSFSTTASTPNEHNLTQISHTHSAMIHKPRLPYPVPTIRTQSQKSPTTTIIKPQPQISAQYTYRKTPVHQDTYPQQTPNIPTTAHNEQYLKRIQPHTHSYNYLEQEITQPYPLRRSPALQNLKVVDDIQTILTNDQFVKDIESDNIDKHISESDTDSSHELFGPPRRQRCSPPQPKPRQHITRSQESRRIISYTPPTHEHQKPQNIMDTKTKRQTIQPTPGYTILYDEENLFCHGKGWQNKFLTYPNRTLLKSVKANLQLSDATTFNTEEPFSDLRTQISQKTPNKTHIPQNQPSNSTSSNTSIQNLLSSTINESSPPHCIQPIISPITKNTQQQFQINSNQEYDPKETQHLMEQFEQTDTTLRNTFLPHESLHDTTTQSLPPHNTSAYHTNETIPQNDGNDSEPENTTETKQQQQKLPEEKIQQQMITKLNNIKTTNPPNTLQATINVLTETRTQFDQSQPETTLQRAIRHKLQKCIRRQNDQTQIQPTNTNQEENNTTTEQKDIQDHTNISIPEDTTEDSLQYADIPEEALHMIKRNKQIIKNISIRTQEEETQDEISELSADLQEITHEMKNLTYKLRQQEDATMPTGTNITTSSTETPNEPTINNPYLHTFPEAYPREQQEKSLTSNFTTVHLNVLSQTELKDMEAKTGHRCRDTFDMKKEMYEQTLIDIENININLKHRLTTERITPHFAKQLELIKKHLLRLRKRQVGLEDKLRTISTIDENNNAGIIMPTFGDKKRENHKWKNVPNFNPKNDTTFDIIWNIIVARGMRYDLDEESYKDILEEILKGESLKYYTKNQHKPLREIIEILYNAYVTTQSKHQIRTELENFRTHKDDTFRQTLEKLKLSTSELFKDAPPDRAAQEEQIELRRRITENKLVNKAALAAVIRKEKEYHLEGKHFDFIRELIQETDVQREAGNMQPEINTLTLYNTTASNQTPSQTNKNEIHRVNIGKTDQNHVSARPRPPSQEKLDRIFRHSPSRLRPRSTTPNTTSDRQQSPSPNRNNSPQHISSNIQRDTESRQRNNRQDEYNRRRFDNKQNNNFDNRNFDFRNNQNNRARQQQRQHSTEQPPRYNQYLNKNYQTQRQRSSSAIPNQNFRNQTYQPRKQNNFRQYNNQNYNNPNFQPIGKPNFQRERPNNNNMPNNKTQHINNRIHRTPSPNQNTSGPRRFQTNNYQTRNQQQPYYPRYNDNRQYRNGRILQHHMTYTGGNDREGRIQQEFSVTDLCNKNICQGQPEHSYKQCPMNKQGFHNRH